MTLKTDVATVALNDVLNVTVTVFGAEMDLPQRIEVDGFEMGGRPSVSNRWSSGDHGVTPSVSYTYQLYPKRPGAFTLGPYAFEIDGQTYVSNRVQVRVTERRESPKGEAPPDGRSSTARPPARTFRGGRAQVEDVFVRSEVDRDDVYVGEQVLLAVRLYTRLHVSNLRPTEPPDLTGFWVEAVPVPRSLSGVKSFVKGEKYTVFTVKKAALFPAAPGELAIGAMAWEMSVSDTEFFFSAPKRIRLATDPLTVRVRPLPERGKPIGYRGAVGTFTLSGAVRPSTVKVNDAVTFTVTISGRGNVRTLEEPPLPDLSDFKTYTSKSSEAVAMKNGAMEGSKTWEYVLVPKAPGRQVIPSVKVSFFDPGRGAYETAETEPLIVRVEKSEEAGLFVQAAGEQPRQEVRLVQQDISYIRFDLDAVGPPYRLPLGMGWLIAVLSAPVLFTAWLAVHTRKRDRERADEGMTRYRKAGRLARRKLRAAGRRIDARAPGTFFGVLSDALKGCVADKANCSPAGLTKPDIDGLLRKAGIAPGDVSRFKAFLAACDRFRFAPVSTDANEMKRYLREAHQWIRRLERQIEAPISGGSME